ncbi:putative ATP synthase subunit f, mitochondrial [Mercenaria mercenaria]|uniref:putative ATP synthase subunit f, mitochondrial n=1 Tax=Mercenaria mercenaria TaxID=6596 RepID=UPI001E1E1B30|nr:putative ATP synthase subunit f, mitochondrial [Mercenaria mercenaria]
MSADPLQPKFKINLNKYPSPYNPYHPEYNARIHGPYDPSRYYGKEPKMSMWDLKLGDIPKKLLTSDKSPQNIFGVISRFMHRYNVRHHRAARFPLNWVFQIALLGYAINYIATWGVPSGLGGRKCEQRYRYHW